MEVKDEMPRNDGVVRLGDVRPPNGCGESGWDGLGFVENRRWYFGDFAFAWMKGGEGKYQSLLEEEGTAAESESRDMLGIIQ